MAVLTAAPIDLPPAASEARRRFPHSVPGERRPFRRVVTTAVLIALLCVGTPGAVASASTAGLTPRQGSYEFHLHFGGLSRDYLLHVPPAASRGRPLPLVLNLHGYSWNAALQEAYSDMDATADQHGFLVAYPDGTLDNTTDPQGTYEFERQLSWNAGQCCGLPVTRHVNDVGFLLRVIADVASRTPVDLHRVYVTGMSAGGMMAYAMAARASRHIAAIASVSGQVELPAIHPARPVATMEFHSVSDPIARYYGTPGAPPGQRYSVPEGIHKWVVADGCDDVAHTGPTVVGAPGSPNHGESVTPISYTGCRGGTEVALWRFAGSGHVWPGSPLNTGPPKTWTLGGVGRGTTLVDANQVMWSFFSRFSLP